MIDVLPILLKDGYKVGHVFQYPKDTQFIYCNFTPRKSRAGFNHVVVFGIQYFIKEFLDWQYNENFFSLNKDTVLTEYRRRIDHYLYQDAITIDHIAALHDLQYLPLHVKALPEGTLCPTNVPMLTITNTLKEFYWLPNKLETILSNTLWLACNSATTALRYRLNFEHFADLTGANRDFIQWQGHDFSFRGMGGLDAALTSGAGHLLSFVGTDTLPAIDFLEEYYETDCEKELIGGSVAATEHSVMCIGEPENEFETFKRLITEVYSGNIKEFQIVSIVSDTWDLWQVVTDFLPRLKSEIMARNGKVVIRPDSGDPADIICGNSNFFLDAERKGLIQCLWEIFGGTTNAKGYKTLDSHIGAIYGDSITLERQLDILERLRANGFASDNIVLGLGSYTYQYNTRDTYGFAMKATAGINNKGLVEIFKKPKTDDGTKNSHKGLLCVVKDDVTGDLKCLQGVSAEQEKKGLLQTVFLDGELFNLQSLTEIRERVAMNWKK